jgi:(p)ppGpp synthase/HD superfamily hydrolase
MILAYNAHHEQFDKGGVPYIYHPIHLAEQMDTESEIIAALLHDVVEDTDTTIADLEQRGFPPDAIEAISILTHDDDLDYFEYLKLVAENQIALKVKRADLDHNSDEERLKMSNLDKATKERLRNKYAKAKALLAANIVSREGTHHEI